MSTSKNLKAQSIGIRTGLYTHKLPKLSTAAWNSFCLQVPVSLGVAVESMAEGVKRGVNYQGKVTGRGWTGGSARGGDCCLERVPLMKLYGSKPCSVNTYWETISREKGRRGDKERKGHTRNQSNVNGRRMSMILLRLSIDSLLRVSDRETGQIHRRCCMITETHLVNSYAKKSTTATTLHVSSVGQTIVPRCRHSVI